MDVGLWIDQINKSVTKISFLQNKIILFVGEGPEVSYFFFEHLDFLAKEHTSSFLRFKDTDY